MRRKISIVLLGAALALGCGHRTVSTSECANPIGSPTYVQDKRVITDGDVDKIARILSVNEGLAGDLMRVQVMVQNTRPIPQSFNYMFEWYDLNGMQVSTPTSIWSSVTLQGRDTKALQATAPNSRAKDFRLKLQEMKK